MIFIHLLWRIANSLVRCAMHSVQWSMICTTDRLLPKETPFSGLIYKKGEEIFKNLNQNVSSGRTLSLYQSETYRWLACEMSAIFQELAQSVERSGSAILGPNQHSWLRNKRYCLCPVNDLRVASTITEETGSLLLETTPIVSSISFFVGFVLNTLTL